MELIGSRGRIPTELETRAQTGALECESITFPLRERVFLCVSVSGTGDSHFSMDDATSF